MPIKQVFVSYSHRDSDFVNEFASLLLSFDLNVWKDSKDLPIGANIPKTVYEGIKGSSHFCCIISDASVRSRWVEEELSFAKMRQLDTTELMIIPILISQVEIPDYVKVYRCANLQDRDLKPTNPEIARIIRAFGIDNSERLTHILLGVARKDMLAACSAVHTALWNLRDHVQVFSSIRKHHQDQIRSFADTLASTSYSEYTRYSNYGMYSSGIFGSGPQTPSFVPDHGEMLRKYTAEENGKMRLSLDAKWAVVKPYAQEVLDTLARVDESGRRAGLHLLEVDTRADNLEAFELWNDFGDALRNLHSLCAIIVSGPSSEIGYIETKIGFFSDVSKLLDDVISLLKSWAKLERIVR